jgi:hypothetical protein
MTRKISEVDDFYINPSMPELNPPPNAACRDFFLGILIFKALTARRLFKSFGFKGLKPLSMLNYVTCIFVSNSGFGNA